MTACSFLKTGIALLAFATAPVFAADKPAKTPEDARDYVRYVGDNLRGKLETVVVTLTNAAGAKVELIGAVHIADAAYYQTLTKLFTGYEVLLFELVDGQRLKQGMEVAPVTKRPQKAP